MINFRYHVVSLVAIFLALGIGIVMGSTVIDRAIVDGLKNRINTAEKNSIDRKNENDRLRGAVEEQDKQDQALSPHVVNGALADQTVYVVSIGDVADDVRVETRELLAVSGARLAAEIDLNEDFVRSDKTKFINDALALENLDEVVGNVKNKNQQSAIIINTYFLLRAGGSVDPSVDYGELNNLMDSYDVFSEQEQAPRFDPVQNVSIIVLAKRTDLADQKVRQFTARFHGTLPVTIGLVGTDTDTPDREEAIENLGDQVSAFTLVDNAESPSGRAALLLAHARCIQGVRDLYGISSKATSYAPELSV